MPDELRSVDIDLRPLAEEVEPRSAPLNVAAVVSYLLIAMTANLHAWIAGPTHTLLASPDATQEAWFLGFIPHALAHGNNPFVTDWANYPTGFNLLVNTSLILPATLLAPITLIFGPILAFNVLMVLALAGSATSAYFVLRAFVSHRWAAFLGGLLFGFSPFMVGQSAGHMFLIFLPAIPLLFYVGYRIFVTQQGNPIRWGILLGVCVVAQFLTSTEVLADAAVLAVPAVVYLLLRERHELIPPSSFQIRAILAGALTFLIICGYPLILLLVGPEHISGPAQPVSLLAPIKSDLLTPVVPNLFEELVPQVIRSFGDRLFSTDFAEHGGYLGMPLIILMIYGYITLRRSRRIVRFAGFMLLCSFVLSMGSRLSIGSHSTSIPLPFAILTRLPLVQSIVASRFSLFTAFFAAILLGLTIDQLQSSGLSSAISFGRNVVFLASVSFVAFVPLVPAWPTPETQQVLPSFYSSKIAKSIPYGSAVLEYPFPTPQSPQALLWQVMDGVRYKVLGGYFIYALPDGMATFNVTISDIAIRFASEWSGARLPPDFPRLNSSMRTDLIALGVGTIIVIPDGTHPQQIVSELKSIIGVNPEMAGGAWVWQNVQGDLSSHPCKVCAGFRPV